MNNPLNLSIGQHNILIASIIGDGEISKLYPIQEEMRVIVNIMERGRGNTGNGSNH